MQYANPEVDRLLEEARVEMEPARRMQLYVQAEELIVADAPWVPLWHSVDYVLTKPYVKGAVYAILHFASPASPIDYLELPIETL